MSMSEIISGKYAGNYTCQAPKLAKKDGLAIVGIDIVQYEPGRELSLGKAVVGGLLMGPVGAIAGAVIGKKKTFMVQLTYNDDETSLAECNKSDMRILQNNLYEIVEDEEDSK